MLVVATVIVLAGIGLYLHSSRESMVVPSHDASPAASNVVEPDDSAPSRTQSTNAAAGLPDEDARTLSAQQHGSVPTAPEEWRALYHGSTDRSEFIKMASDAAMRGDGRAAFYVSEALLTCVLVVHTYRGSQNPEAQFAQEKAQYKGPQWGLDRLERNFRRCISLASEDPFAHLPERAGGYPRQYWFDRALALGDSMAKVNRVAMSLPKLYEDGSEEKKTLTTAQVKADLRDIVLSKDPHALYVLGFTLMNGQYSSNPFRGVAITLAACDLGFDCTSDNPDSVNAVCKESWECSPHESFAENMQSQLGTKYTEVYFMAEEFKEALARNDERAFNRFIEIKAP
ncbi:MAG TPA: hypothetical protein PKE27_20945 [Povalibacter sp.]|uniref:hypothetical protein n=1 Tax=Povalibacter sp. TaxID=1962978 RepID=UPI002C80FDA1|nr:hypothetical protein [Povalibacter sp.]HMN47058.1 hypothetical protein [Povalibacter sp.]